MENVYEYFNEMSKKVFNLEWSESISALDIVENVLDIIEIEEWHFLIANKLTS